MTTQEATVRRPALLVVDDEPPVLRAVQPDLRGRFGEAYRVLRAGSGAEAEDTSGSTSTAPGLRACCSTSRGYLADT